MTDGPAPPAVAVAPAGSGPPPAVERVVMSGTAALAVFEWPRPSPSAPTVVLAHGWPDSHDVWDLVAARLASRFHVVTFDLRGVGRSTPALEHRPYALPALAADLAAVVTAASPGRPAHVVGHDWGSVVGWELVQTPVLAARVASFTSVSGPNLDLVGSLLRRRPGRQAAAALADQAVRSAYTVVLGLPLVRTLPWRLGGARLLRRWLAWTEGVTGYPGAGLARDALAGVGLYRTNIVPRLLRPDLRPVRVPVQVVVATRDRYVSPRMAAVVARWVPDAVLSPLVAGHWSPRTHPGELAERVTAHVGRVERQAAGAAPEGGR